MGVDDRVNEVRMTTTTTTTTTRTMEESNDARAWRKKKKAEKSQGPLAYSAMDSNALGCRRKIC